MGKKQEGERQKGASKRFFAACRKDTSIATAGILLLQRTWQLLQEEEGQKRNKKEKKRKKGNKNEIKRGERRKNKIRQRARERETERCAIIAAVHRRIKGGREEEGNEKDKEKGQKRR